MANKKEMETLIFLVLEVGHQMAWIHSREPFPFLLVYINILIATSAKYMGHASHVVILVTTFKYMSINGPLVRCSIDDASHVFCVGTQVPTTCFPRYYKMLKK